ncbi:arylamine N-acetyltransferase [Streptomyces sp. NPDC058576]|uniref:arylamine N-acetyltransferase family protein n=1 Tax=Streptomyces sp. NPDC058576 TaxID=3346547 RepID=UPI0036483ADF
MAKEKNTLPPPPESDREGDPQWGGQFLDLDSYLRRTGYTGPRTATTDTLFALHRAHRETIPFENIDVALGRGISLDIGDVQHKLVERGRGGYCFEHNLLFAVVLERLGFPVTRMLARVRLGTDQTRYRAHTVLIVTAGSRHWLADVGFGSRGLVEPIPFEPGSQSRVAAWQWQLGREEDTPTGPHPDGGGGQWVLRSLRPDGWFDLYAFRLERHFQVDFDVANHYTSQHERSTFTGKVIAMHGTAREHRTLVDRELTTHYPDGRIEHSEVSAGEAVHLLRGSFAIDLSDQDALLLRQRLSHRLSPLQEAS